MSGRSDDRAEPGLRERNKIDKRNRIKAAVRELVASKGYDDMTTREIARRAGVGLGTLFFYATNKRDLLFLVYNDDNEALLAEADAAALSDASYLDRLMAIFRPFYAHFAEDPVFSRYLLRELTFYEKGSEAQRFQDGRRGIVDRIERATVDAQSRSAIGSDEASRTVARLLFAVYQAELRRWLQDGPAPSAEQGLDKLRQVLRIVICGLDPAEGAV